MKKTTNINLGGQAFCIDEDACIKLQSYINTLEKYYLKEEGGSEIISDIESRLAELLKGYLNESRKEVITINNIDQAIQVMGTPDDIIDETDSENTTQKKINKILYRDPENCILGGVASGIATYLGASTILIRLLFIISAFFFGITIILYIILWIIIPRAVTAKQKLEMKGEPINVSNIERNIRDNYNEMKENGRLRGFIEQIEKFLGNFFKLLGNILKKMLSVILSIVSVMAIIFSIILIIAFFWGMLFSSTLPWGSSYGGITYLISFGLWTKILMSLIILIPLLLAIYLSLKYLIGFKSKNYIPLYAGGVWLISCLTGVILIINLTIQFSQEQSETTQQTIECTNTSKCIAIRTAKSQSAGNPNRKIIKTATRGSMFDFSVIDSAGNIQLTNKPELYISTTDGPKAELYVRKRARGFSEINARQNAQAIRFGWELKNDTLSFDDTFTLTGTEKWRNNEVDITLCLPENYRIDLVNLTAWELANSRIINDTTEYENRMSVPKQYIMKEGRLLPVK